MKKGFKLYVFNFLFISFIGWLWEVFIYFLSEGKFVNSGTLIGPWLPIYGFTALLFSFLYDNIKRPLFLFLSCFFVCYCVEFFTSLYLELIYHARWWDYSGFFFNVGGRVSLEVTLFFSIIGGFVVNYFIPWINKKISINSKLFKFIMIVIFVFFVIDFVYSTFNPNIL